MSQPPIDLDSESIQYDGRWYTRDELAKRIKGMLDAGDFAVSRPSQALEVLTQAITQLRTVSFRASAEMGDAIAQVAKQSGRAPGALIRDALTQYLGSAIRPATNGVAAKHEAPSATPNGSQSSTPAAASANKGHVIIPPPPVVNGVANAGSKPLAGPGAMHAAATPPPADVLDDSLVTEEPTPEEAAQAVSLNPKKKEEETVERGWFGR
jgi:hypothetical protein